MARSIFNTPPYEQVYEQVYVETSRNVPIWEIDIFLPLSAYYPLSDWRPPRVPPDTRTALSQAHQRFRSLKDHFQRALVMLYKSLSKNILIGSQNYRQKGS